MGRAKGYTEKHTKQWLDWPDRVSNSKSRSVYRFRRKNIISCVGVPFRTLVWNYICWFLAGKPEMKEQEIK